MRTREIIVLRLGAQLGAVAIADVPWHRLTPDLVEVLTPTLPLDLAVVAAGMLAKEYGLPTAVVG